MTLSDSQVWQGNCVASSTRCVGPYTAVVHCRVPGHAACMSLLGAAVGAWRPQGSHTVSSLKILSAWHSRVIPLSLSAVCCPSCMQQNLGAMLRSAFCLGVSGVLACSRNCAPLSPVVSKSSAGAMELMSLYSCK